MSRSAACTALSAGMDVTMRWFRLTLRFISRPVTLIALIIGVTLGLLWTGFSVVSIHQRQMALDQAGSKLASVSAATAFYADLLLTESALPTMGEQTIPGWVNINKGRRTTTFPNLLRALRSGEGTRIVLSMLSPEESTKVVAQIRHGKMPPAYHIVGDQLVASVASLDGRLRAVSRQPITNALATWQIARLKAASGLLALTILVMVIGFMLIRRMTRDAANEFKLREAVARADAANRAKSEFLANMSHELRTPLNAIIGFADVLKGDVVGPIDGQRARDYGDHIFQSGMHLLDVVNDILDISKFDAGQLQLDEEEVDLEELIDSCVTLMRDLAVRSKVILLTKIDAPLPHLSGDSRRLKQVLFNLISNALKFTPEGGTVKVACCREEKGIALVVSDTGIGMSTDQIVTAMERFGQVDSPMSRTHGGTGLGLPLVQHLVELHDGTLSIQSKPEVGTMVTAHLPQARVLCAKERMVAA